MAALQQQQQQQQQSLTSALQLQFGLRNIRQQWIRRQTVLSVDIIKGPITRTDLREISTGTLPWNITQAHSVQLGVKALVQIHDVINVANSNPRSNQHPRVLQFSMSDGALEFVAVELTPLGARLSLQTIPGTKIILLPCTLIRRGRVMLTASDFEFLGAPSVNIWGNDYQRHMDNALKQAGLPNPNHSSFDSIATSREAQRAGLAHVIPVHMGGIADVIPDTQRASGQADDDGDDDGFWAHAVQLADQNVTASAVNSAPVVPQTTAHTTAHTNARALPQQLAPPPTVIDIEDLPVECVHETPQSPPHQDVFMENVQPQHGSNSPHHQHQHRTPQTVPAHVPDTLILEIPSTPVFESDHPVQQQQQQQQSQLASQDDDILNMLHVPPLPFSRLAEAITNGQQNSTTLHRVYSMKTARKNVVEHNGVNGEMLLLSAQLDDGTAVELLPLYPQLAQDITGLETDSEQFRADVQNGHMRMRTAIRGIHGFIQLHNGIDGAHVISVTKGIPDQESKDFLSSFANNVEARLANYIMEAS